MFDATPTLDTHAALVAIIRRAAQRGREIREQNETTAAGDSGRAESNEPVPVEGAHDGE